MTAPHIWPSTAVTVSASAISRITWLNPTPHRLTVYASAAPLPVAPATLVTRRLATPYLGGTFPRWIALASSQRTPASSESARYPPYLMMKRRETALFSIGLKNPYFPLGDGVAGAEIILEGRCCINYASYN